jgi:hypothetical protein
MRQRTISSKMARDRKVNDRVLQFVVTEQTAVPRVFPLVRGADGRARRSDMPLLFWLPMIFLSAMIELSVPPRL